MGMIRSLENLRPLSEYCMVHKLSTDSGMKGFLEKYNYFHDALLESVEFSSNDFFSGKPPAHTITRQFNAALSIYHYNFQKNLSQAIYCVSMELHGLGAFSLCSGDGDKPSRHWALTRVGIDPLINTPDRWRMTIIGEKLDAITAKWTKTNLAQIEFAYLVFKVRPCKSVKR